MRHRCGCELIREAQREPDPTARGPALLFADEMREMWNCPGAGDDEPEVVGDEAAASLRAVEALTGLKLRTCPHWYAAQPCAYTAARARRWRDKGQLGDLAEQPSVLAEAIDEIDFGVEDRQRDDDERRKRKLETK